MMIFEEMFMSSWEKTFWKHEQNIDVQVNLISS